MKLETIELHRPLLGWFAVSLVVSCKQRRLRVRIIWRVLVMCCWELRGRIWETGKLLYRAHYGPRPRFWWNLAQRWVLAQNPPPTNFFWILTPKTGSFWGRKGRKISDFLNLFFTVKKARGHSEKNFVDKKVPFWAQERPREISRGYVKRRRRYGQFCEKRVLLVKVFYTRR